MTAIHFFGDHVYGETRFKVGSSRKLTEDLKVGLLMQYHHLSLSGYQLRHTASMSFNMLLSLGNNFKLASAWDHLMQVGNQELVPQRFTTAIEYQRTAASLMCAVEKEGGLPPEICIGGEFKLGQRIQFAGGYRDLSQTLSMGWRFSWSRYACHYVIIFHPDLPVSHGFGVELVLP